MDIKQNNNKSMDIQILNINKNDNKKLEIKKDRKKRTTPKNITSKTWIFK